MEGGGIMGKIVDNTSQWTPGASSSNNSCGDNCSLSCFESINK